MRSSFEFLKIAFIQSLQYRAELVVWILLTIANMGILVLVWGAIFQDHTQLNGYSLAHIVEYYFIITLIDTVSAVHFETWRVREIREGRIDTYLTKPVSYPLQIFLQDLGGKLFWFSLSIPLLGLSFFALKMVIPELALTISPQTALSFVPLVLFSYLLEFCFAFMTVVSAFWFEGADGLQHFKWIVISLFSGFMIPVALMPPWLQQIVQVLPFKYLYAVPAGILQGTAQLNGQDLLTIGVVGSSAMFATTLLWRAARAHYSSGGG